MSTTSFITVATHTLIYLVLAHLAGQHQARHFPAMLPILQTNKRKQQGERSHGGQHRTYVLRAHGAGDEAQASSTWPGGAWPNSERPVWRNGDADADVQFVSSNPDEQDG